MFLIKLSNSYAMRRKKSKSFFLSIGKAVAWLIVNFFKAVYYVLAGIFNGIKFAFKKTHASVKAHREKSKIKAEQPKTPAVYQKLVSANTVKGSLSVFENRLLNESLIVAIAGRRGSGKSVLGFRLLENVHAKTNRPAFALGVKESVLPEWIKSIDDLNSVEKNGIVLIDEGAVSFSSRSSMSKENKSLAGLLAIARHKDLTLLFITQNTGMIDKNVLNLCDTVILKEGSLLQEKMERSVMKDMYQSANREINKLPSSERKYHCYVFDADFEGLIKTELPGFWSSKVSKNQA